MIKMTNQQKQMKKQHIFFTHNKTYETAKINKDKLTKNEILWETCLRQLDKSQDQIN